MAQEKKYNVYKFKDGDALASKKPLHWFRPETGPKLVASNLSWDEACQLETVILKLHPDCFKQIGLTNEQLGY